MSGWGSRYEKSWSASSIVSSLITIAIFGDFFLLAVGTTWGNAWVRSMGGS